MRLWRASLSGVLTCSPAPVQKAAGVVLFSNLKFSAAVPYLQDTDLDARELISFFPGYLPKGSKFKSRHGLTLEYLITETLIKRTKAQSAPADRVLKVRIQQDGCRAGAGHANGHPCVFVRVYSTPKRRNRPYWSFC